MIEKTNRIPRVSEVTDIPKIKSSSTSINNGNLDQKHGQRQNQFKSNLERETKKLEESQESDFVQEFKSIEKGLEEQMIEQGKVNSLMLRLYNLSIKQQEIQQSIDDKEKSKGKSK